MKYSNQITDKTLYSLAITDFKIFIQTLSELKSLLKEPISEMNKIIDSNVRDSLLEEYIKKNILSKLYEAKKYIKRVKSTINRYKQNNGLQCYMEDNKAYYYEFQYLLKDINELIRLNEVFLDLKIDTCNDYFEGKYDKEELS